MLLILSGKFSRRPLAGCGSGRGNLVVGSKRYWPYEDFQSEARRSKSDVRERLLGDLETVWEFLIEHGEIYPTFSL